MTITATIVAGKSAKPRLNTAARKAARLNGTITRASDAKTREGATAKVVSAFYLHTQDASRAADLVKACLTGLDPDKPDYKTAFNAVRRLANIGTMAYLLRGNKPEGAAVLSATKALDMKVLLRNGDKANAGQAGVRTDAQQRAFDTANKRFTRLCTDMGIATPNHGKAKGAKSGPTDRTGKGQGKGKPSETIEVKRSEYAKLAAPSQPDHDLALLWLKEQGQRLRHFAESQKQRGARIGKVIVTSQMEEAIALLNKALADAV